MVRYLFYTIGDLTYQSPLVISGSPFSRFVEYLCNNQAKCFLCQEQHIHVIRRGKWINVTYCNRLHKCSSSGGYSCTLAAYGTVTLYESSWWPVGIQLEWELYRQATKNSHREWQYHMLHVYNCILLKMSTWGSKHVEENIILWINNNWCINLVINI